MNSKLRIPLCWKVGTVVSSVANVTVVDKVEDVAEDVTVSPELLQLAVGESRTIGSDVQVTRGGVDLSRQATISPADPRIVEYDSEQGLLTAVSPGRTRVSYSAGGQLVHQDIEVVAAEVPAPDTRVELIPNGGVLAVGERLKLRGLQFCESCRQSRTGKTTSLVLTSSDPTICEVDGNSLVGLKPGRVEISGRLPGIDNSTQATFTVVDSQISRLAIEPPLLNLATGQQRNFQVFAITPSGRRLLGAHPDLKLSLEDDDVSAVDLNADGQIVAGLTPGRTKLVARWRDSAEARIPVRVKGDPIQAIRIEPADSTVTVGETQNYQIFVQRGSEWLPVESASSAALRSQNTKFARVKQGLQVEGVQAGTALIVANYANRRAEARLQVGNPKTPEGTAARKPPPTPPQGKAVGLRFIPDLFRLEMGTPGDSVRVVKIYSDGKQEDVDHLVKLSVRDPQNVIELEATGSGPVVRPLRIGQTQIDASLDDLRTPAPLLVDVVESLPKQAHLRVVSSPNPMRLQSGEEGRISLVQVVPSRGGKPFEVPYKLSASPSPVISVDDSRKSIKALKGGNAVANIAVVSPGSGYDGLNATVTVEVVDDQAIAQESRRDLVPDEPRLILDGPTETTVGADIQLHVERLQGERSSTVTSEAELSLVDGERGRAELKPGCRLTAKQAGRIRVQARHAGALSMVHEIEIRPASTEYERLVLSIGATPLAVGELRNYEIWGYPRGSNDRQDLTNLGAANPPDGAAPRVSMTVLQPDSAATVVEHRPPQVVGVKPGVVRLEASTSNGMKSNAIELTVVAEAGNQPIQLRIEPPRAVLREGERSPQLRVLVRSRGSTAFREVDNAKLESLDANVLAPLPNESRVFSAAKPGETQIRATFGNLSELADIRVIPDRFRTIRSELEMGRKQFSLKLEILTSPSAEKLEYRVILSDSSEASQWTAAVRKPEGMATSLKTPLLQLGPSSEVYRLVLEVRDTGSNAVERYPYSFQIKSDIVERRE